MDRAEVRRRVALLFPAGARGARTTRVAVEHELLVADAVTGSHVPVHQVRAATAHAPYAAYLGFEPGGQVELSLPTSPCPGDLSRRLRADLAALRRDCARASIRLEAQPIDARSESAVPLQLVSPRYVAMQLHFDAIGSAGRTMMRRTASTQVCLDWWPGRTGLEQWRVLQLAAPFVAAAFARSVGPCSRLATWLAVDPSRTAFDGRLLHGDSAVGAYADFASSATVFTTPGDVPQHLTTLFPPVRPRGRYVEVRFPDVQPDDAVGPLVSTLAALAYDDHVRSEVLRRLAGERDRLDRHWYDAAHGTGDVADFGRDLLTLTGVGPLDGAA